MQAICDEVESAEKEKRQPNYTNNEKETKCQEQRMANYVKHGPNTALCREVVGEFDFHRFQFAPRFFKWGNKPVEPPPNEIQTIEPYTLDALPENMSEWSKKFVENAHKLGVRVAPSKDRNWHIDGIDKKKVAQFAMLWGSYLTELPKGGMGNFLVYPGTHHTIAHLLKTQGAQAFF